MKLIAHVLLWLGLLAVPVAAFGQVASGPGDYPQWRGPNRDGISPDKGLLKEWPEGGPQVAWSVDTVGVGYSAIAVKDGRIFTQGDLNGVEHIIALSAKDGAALWAVQPEPVKAALDVRVAEEMERMDADKNGVVSESEALARLHANFNKYDQPQNGVQEADDEANRALANTRAASLMSELDANNDGALDLNEAGQSFSDDYANIDASDSTADAAALAKQRTDAMLKEYDKDIDGVITRDESRRTGIDRLFGRMDQNDPVANKRDDKLTEQEINEYLSKREAGKDGRITQEELADYYAKRYPGRDGVLTKDELRGYLGGYRNGQGDGPRGTPTVDGDKLYAEGGNGDLTCLEVATGKTLWHKNLVADFGGGRPGWGYCESPLIVGDMLIVTPGGKGGAVVALDKYTGDEKWRSTDTTQGAHYASAIHTQIGGVDQIVQFGRSSMFGVTLEDGKLLWEYGGANNGTANVATPIVADDSVFASSAYGTGGGLAKITTNGDKTQTAEEEYFSKKFANHHGGIVKVGDYLYGTGSGSLICMNFHTGKIEWQARAAGKGSLTVADGMLYLLGERHEVALAEATPEEYREHGNFKIESYGRPSWAHPVVIGGKLYIRNQQSLTAYNVRD